MKTKLFLIGFLLMAGSILYAQEKENNTIPLIGSKAPAFTAETTNGVLKFPDDFTYYWKILFSHPKDFTPVCTSEIMQLARMQDVFESLAVKVAVISTDTKERHELWKKSIEEALSSDQMAMKISFPFISDDNTNISRLYGMLHLPVSTTKDVRGVFIISPDNVVMASLFYPMNIGRNMDEIVRIVEALQTAQASKLSTPVNWKPGEDLIVPHHPYTAEEIVSNPKVADGYHSVGSFVWYRKRFLP